jgi:hypothetical protein
MPTTPRKRIPPSPDQIGHLVQESLNKHGSNVALIPESEALAHLRAAFRTTPVKAREWLYAAMEQGAVEIMKASHKGAHLSRVVMADLDKLNLKPGERRPRYMLDSFDDEASSIFKGMIADDGTVHMVDELPDDMKAAADESYWVTVPAVRRELIEATRRYTNHKLLMSQAGKAVETARLDMLHGDSIAVIRALFDCIGDPEETVEARVYDTMGTRPEFTVVTMRLKDAEIDAFADRLRRLGIGPS